MNSISQTLEFKGTNAATLNLTNAGAGVLTYSYTLQLDPNSPQQLPVNLWLQAQARDGLNVQANQTGHLDLTLNCPEDARLNAALRMAPATSSAGAVVRPQIVAPPPPEWPVYNAVLTLITNDPNAPSTPIPVTLTCRHPFDPTTTNTYLTLDGPTGIVNGSFALSNATDAPVHYNLSKMLGYSSFSNDPRDWLTITSPAAGVVPARGFVDITVQGQCFVGGRNAKVIFVHSESGSNSHVLGVPSTGEWADFSVDVDLTCRAPYLAGFLPRSIKMNSSDTYRVYVRNTGAVPMRYSLSSDSATFSVIGDSQWIQPSGDAEIQVNLTSGQCGDTVYMSVLTDDSLNPGAVLPITVDCAQYPKPIWYWGANQLAYESPDIALNNIELIVWSQSHCNTSVFPTMTSNLNGYAYFGLVTAGLMSVSDQTFLPGYFARYDQRGYPSDTIPQDPSLPTRDTLGRTETTIRAQIANAWDNFVSSHCHLQ